MGCLRRRGEKTDRRNIEKKDAILRKYRNILYPSGLDTDPSAKELHEITKWFGKEILKLREKYGIK